MNDEIIYCIYDAGKLSDIAQMHDIRRLGEDGLDMFNDHLILCGQCTISDEKWREMLNDGTEYYLLIIGGQGVCRCCIERYSDDKWEAADVRCAADYRGMGLATELIAYVTRVILDAGRIATCRTLPDNTAMIRVMENAGYRKMEK